MGCDEMGRVRVERGGVGVRVCHLDAPQSDRRGLLCYAISLWFVAVVVVLAAYAAAYAADVVAFMVYNFVAVTCFIHRVKLAEGFDIFVEGMPPRGSV